MSAPRDNLGTGLPIGFRNFAIFLQTCLRRDLSYGEFWGVQEKNCSERAHRLAQATVDFRLFECRSSRNVLNAMFIEAMIEHAKKDDQLVPQMETESQDKYIDKIQGLFYHLDNNCDG